MRCLATIPVALALLAGTAAAQTASGARCGDNLGAGTPGPAITAAEICATIAVLAHDSLAGRAAGTPEGAAAAEWIADRFAELGLLAPEGGHLQSFAFPRRLARDPHAEVAARAAGSEEASDAETAVTANVVGIVRGFDPALSGQAVVIGAHYDHLGRAGEPGERVAGSLDPGSDAVHNGADDNASGVAGLLELAGRFAADPPGRTVVFLAFGAEEPGILGSRHWVRNPLWPLDRTVAMVNLDMIGRMRERLTVYGTGTSEIWPALLDSLEAAGAPPIQRVPDGIGPSDHAAFYPEGVPVIALFTGTHEDYHRPTDDVELVHADGAARVVEFAAALVEAIADGREVPWTEAPRSERRAMAFSVGLGVVPDYGFAGTGLAVASVRGGGPAHAAGLAAGDVIVRLAGREVADVYAYTEILAGLEAGEAVEVTYARGGAEQTATVTPEAR
ncbi:MAG TPA: M20/M25/M40 family metallo-hydrolase [Gemmatimonadota bacterium]|nr:M20/M25/M40 family metallo-hydrolase [Gemmatimonadota bacterium]